MKAIFSILICIRTKTIHSFLWINLLQAAMNLFIVVFCICDSQQAKEQKSDHSFFVVLTLLCWWNKLFRISFLISAPWISFLKILIFNYFTSNYQLNSKPADWNVDDDVVKHDLQQCIKTTSETTSESTSEISSTSEIPSESPLMKLEMNWFLQFIKGPKLMCDAELDVQLYYVTFQCLFNVIISDLTIRKYVRKSFKLSY